MPEITIAKQIAELGAVVVLSFVVVYGVIKFIKLAENAVNNHLHTIQDNIVKTNKKLDKLIGLFEEFINHKK